MNILKREPKTKVSAQPKKTSSTKIATLILTVTKAGAIQGTVAWHHINCAKRLLQLSFLKWRNWDTVELPWWLRWWRICLQCRRLGFNPWVGKIPWRREWPPTPVFSPGEFHGQRSLAGYSPWRCRVRHNWATNTFISLSGHHGHATFYPWGKLGEGYIGMLCIIFATVL